MAIVSYLAGGPLLLIIVAGYQPNIMNTKDIFENSSSVRQSFLKIDVAGLSS